MFEKMRKIFGPVAVSVIIGSIALVFVFYGVYNPRTTKGMGAGSVAATVDGEGISLQEYSREYQSRVDFYQNMMKGNKLDPALLKQLGLQRQVIEDLIRRKLLTLQAHKMGLRVSDDEVREKIQEMPYFKKDGKFSPDVYEQVLAANKYSPNAFEDSMREDLLRMRLADFMKGRAKVSEKEIEAEFQTSEDRRQVEYVLVGREAAKKLMSVTDKEIDDFLKTEAGLSAAKAYYEQRKPEYVKSEPKADKKAKKEAKPAELKYYTFDEVKKKVTTELLKDRRAEEATKLQKDLANQVFEKAKRSPGELASFAKAKGLELKTSEKFNRTQGGLAGAGEVPELLSDAFSANSPLTKEPKLYESRMGGFVVARGLKEFRPNPADFTKQKPQLVTQLTTRKEQEMFEQWMTEARSKAKVSINQGLFSQESEE